MLSISANRNDSMRNLNITRNYKDTNAKYTNGKISTTIPSANIITKSISTRKKSKST